MNTFSDLKYALRDQAKKAASSGMFRNDENLREANARAFSIFDAPRPVYGKLNPNSPPVNITRRAMLRLHVYMTRHGVKWKTMDWATFQQWLYDNWDKILKVMLSVLLFIIL